jgi:Holliday junction resolvase RusA-like endonuclease
MAVAVHFTVDGEPVGKGRPRFARRGAYITTYTDAKTVTYESRVRLACMKAMGEIKPLTSPIHLRIEAWMPVPASWPKGKRLKALEGLVVPGKPDLDNIAKAVMDGCQGALFMDDKQVCQLRVAKRYSTQPLVEVYAFEVLP